MYNYVLCSHDRGEKRKVLRPRSLNPGNSLPSLSTFPPDIFASLPYPLTPGTSRTNTSAKFQPYERRTVPISLKMGQFLVFLNGCTKHTE
ncbi:unnamed protein product [Brugia pahangi]|uniref:Ovule protein n=1 Tax=Brugia pahangi TaxID=6280 RepID=A0A0N4T1R1_BRUPA|nr:unnamed protein product [Brugia pahangi]